MTMADNSVMSMLLANAENVSMMFARRKDCDLQRKDFYLDLLQNYMAPETAVELEIERSEIGASNTYLCELDSCSRAQRDAIQQHP